MHQINNAYNCTGNIFEKFLYVERLCINYTFIRVRIVLFCYAYLQALLLPKSICTFAAEVFSKNIYLWKKYHDIVPFFSKHLRLTTWALCDEMSDQNDLASFGCSELFFPSQMSKTTTSTVRIVSFRPRLLPEPPSRGVQLFFRAFWSNARRASAVFKATANAHLLAFSVRNVSGTMNNANNDTYLSTIMVYQRQSASEAIDADC